jgi:hypothetical protein
LAAECIDNTAKQAWQKLYQVGDLTAMSGRVLSAQEIGVPAPGLGEVTGEAAVVGLGDGEQAVAAWLEDHARCGRMGG